jgi:hypothetical protein
VKTVLDRDQFENRVSQLESEWKGNNNSLGGPYAAAINLVIHHIFEGIYDIMDEEEREIDDSV